MGFVGKTVTQNIVSGSEITDGTVTGDDLASDIVISTTTTNTTNGTFLNSSGHNTVNGVVHVKQAGATNNPTMVLEQVGDGGNSGDTQGLHIKIAGQTQGTGKAIRVTTTNASLNSGSAYDPFMISNGGNLEIKNTSNASTLSLNTSGHLSIPLQPVFCGKGFTNGVATNGTTGYSANASHYKVTSVLINQGSHFDNTNGIFTVPTSGIYSMELDFSIGSANWHGISAVKNTTLQALRWVHGSHASVGYSGYDNFEVNLLVSASTNDKLYFAWANGYTAPANPGNTYTMMRIYKIA